MRRFLLPLALVLAPALRAQPTSPRAPAGDAAIHRSRTTQRRLVDSLTRDAVAARRLSSVAVAVIQANDTIGLQVAGVASQAPMARAADRATVYRLGSVTKQFTAAMVLQLAAEGRLSLADTLGQFLPWVPAAWRAVTVAQLLNHTSGIPSYTNMGPAWRTRMAEDMSTDSVIALSAARPLDFAPGSRWAYDNSGYVILGRIVELLDHRAYAASIDARLAQPLHLTSLSYCGTTPRPPHDAAGFERVAGGRFGPAAPLSLTQPHAAGALCASVLDVVRWNRALHGGAVVALPLYTRMTAPEGAASATHYGFGIGRDSTNGRLRFVHSGGINGFASNNSYWPDSALSVVVLANTDGNDVDALAEQLRRVMSNLPLLTRPVPLTLTAPQLDAHRGDFDVALPGRSIHLAVRRVGRLLQVTFDGESPTPLVAIGRHRFMARDDETLQLEFLLTGTTVSGVVLHSGPQTFTGRRSSS